MSKISEYDDLTGIVATAQVPVYDPTGSTAAERDRRMTLATLANAYSMIYGTMTTAEITVGDEDSDVRAISIQLLDAEGGAIASKQVVELVVFADSAGAALASTGGSTGIEIDSDGIILATITAKKVFKALSDAAGLITLTWTDTGTEAAYLGVVLPDGRIVISAAMTNA